MRRFPVLVTLATLLALPQCASASFGVLPFAEVGGNATCLRPTGEPGLLSRLAPTGAALVEASRAGLRAAGVVSLGAAPDACPLVVGHPGGAAIAAVTARAGEHVVLRIATRAPGGDFDAPNTVFTAARGSRLSFDVAVAPDGTAVVAALESAEVDTKDGLTSTRTRVVAVRRGPRGSFAAAETIAPWRTSASTATADVRAGTDDAGVATVAYARSMQTSTGSLRTTAGVARAAPGAAFGPTEVLAEDLLTGLALGVAADGRSIVALTGLDGVRVAERGPQDERFGSLRRLTAQGQLQRSPSVAIAPGGGAIVAWRPGDDGAAIASRGAAGAFGAPVELDPSPSTGSSGEFTVIGSSVIDPDGLDPRTSLVGSGRYVVTWGAATKAGSVPRAASGMLGAPPDDRGGGAALARSPQSVAPVETADGSPGFAWADDTALIFSGGDAPTGGGRLHLALSGAPARREPAPPQIRVVRPRLQTIRPSGFARLVLTCSGPCDVRAVATGRAGQGVSLTSTRGGRLVARIPLDVFATPSTRSLRVVIRATAPGGARATTRRVTLPIRLVRPRPLSRPLAIAAHRSGHDVIVTFHVTRPTRRADYSIAAYRDRSAFGLGVAHVLVHGRGRPSFRLRLRHAAAARYVRVVAFGGADDPPRISRSVRIG